MRIGRDHGLQGILMRPVPAIMIGMISPDERGIGLSHRLSIDIDAKAQCLERLAVLPGQRLAIGTPARLRHPVAKARTNGVEGIGKVAPPGRRSACRPRGGKSPRLPLPSCMRALGSGDLLGAHALEEIILLVERADMLLTQPAPARGAIEAITYVFGRGAKLTGIFAAIIQARAIMPPGHPAMEAIMSARLSLFSQNFSPCADQAPYIGRMVDQSLGPVGQEIETRLRTALSPHHLAVINDSASHRGHMGDDGTGESHFTVEVVADAFTGQSRLQRQRLVNTALGDLMVKTVHALAIKARAPGE